MYDYFEKDHLGNVRMMLTEQQDTSFYPAATMETAQAPTEEAIYSNLPETRTAISTVAGYPTDNTTSPNDEVAEVSGSGQKIGPSVVLKVMAGDHFNIKVSSWYQTNGADPETPNSSLTDLVTNLITGLSSVAVGAHGNVTTSGLQNSGLITPDANSFFNAQPDDPIRPKAYLNWILLDEQFRYVASGSGADQVPAESDFGTPPNQHVYQHVQTNLPVTENGYLYVYVSNETPNIDVFFDNLQVTHIHGQIMEETHYYPFGLTMAGISSKALNGTPENKYKFNKGSELQNKEFSDGSGLELYATNLRSLDPQLGRWWQIDSKPDYAQSLYSAMANNPILYNDPLGDSTIPGAGFWRNAWEGLKDGAKGTGSFIKSLGTEQGWKNLGNSIADAGDRLNPTSPSGLAKNLMAGQQAIETVKNIPNMTKDDVGHALGYGTEKVAEAVVLTKGAGAAGKVLQGTEATETTSTFVKIERAAPGADGATSTHLIEKDVEGNTISVTHQVTKDGEVIHQHQTHISQNVPQGEKPVLKRFPNEWVQFPEINK